MLVFKERDWGKLASQVNRNNRSWQGVMREFSSLGEALSSSSRSLDGVSILFADGEISGTVFEREFRLSITPILDDEILRGLCTVHVQSPFGANRLAIGSFQLDAKGSVFDEQGAPIVEGNPFSDGVDIILRAIYEAVLSGH